MTSSTIQDKVSVRSLEQTARSLRQAVIRMIAPIGQGYVQQGLGAADLFAVLYFAELRLDPQNPSWPERDRCILSTAHNSAVFHAALAERGLIAQESLITYCDDGSPLEINVSERLGPIVEATCGSLGQGLSVGVGMALSAKRQKRESRIYVVLGDGELQEGQVWEAAMAAGHFKLDNLCLIIDLNHMQVEGESVLNMNPLADKWRSFGWAVQELDGHDIPALLAAFEQARQTKNQPSVLIARTIPGRGVKALEGQKSHTIRLPLELAEAALEELAQ